MLRQAKASQVVEARRRRPAIGVAVPLLVGVLAHRWVAIGPGVGLGVIAAIVVVALVAIRRPIVSGGLLLVAIFLSGAVAGRLEMHYYPATDIGAFTASQRRLARLEVVLEDTPRVLSSGGGNRPTTPRQFARASVRQILTREGWTDASGSVLLHLEPPNPDLAAGQTLRVAGWLSRLSPAMNPGQFDFSEHYRRERVVASFSSRQAGNVQIVSPAPAVAPLTFVRTESRQLLAAGFNEAWATEAALLRALLLGDRDPLLRDIQDQFLRTGTSHHLAISGMHIAVVATFVHFLLRLARVSPRTNAIATLAIVFAYAAAALPNPPVVRSVLLCGIVIVGTLLRRDADLVQLLALSVVAMLIYSPLDVYDVGFQLSFGTVLGLMLFARPVFEGLFPG